MSHKDEFIRETRDRFFSSVERAALQYKNDLQEALDTPPARTGKTYKNVKGKEEHTAAAPAPELYQVSVALSPGGNYKGRWEPPAPLSYELLDSISYQGGTTGLNSFTARVYSNVDYVAELEMGNENMAARPVWAETLVGNWGKYSDIALESADRR